MLIDARAVADIRCAVTGGAGRPWPRDRSEKGAAISASEREEGACFSSCNLEEDVGCIQ